MPSSTSRHDHFPRADRARRDSRRRAAAALQAEWQAADAAPGGLLAAMAEVRNAPPEAAIERLRPWLADTGWLPARLAAAVELLAADPFARPPLRLVGGGEETGGLVLAEQGAIRLTLQFRPAGGGDAPPATALFVPGAAAIRVLAGGGARMALHHVAVGAAEAAGAFTAATAARCRSDAPRPLADGEILHLDTARSSFTLAGGSVDTLLLELAVQPPSPLPIRAHDLANGRLVHVSASRRDSSFRAMALTVLRHFGRRDAVSLFVTEAASEDFAVRWHAMRELVALDAAAARPHLAAMAAGDPHPEIRRAAAATAMLFSLPSGETGREGGGGPGPCTSPAPSTPEPARHDGTRAPCPV
ncbi:MAG: hypothetical protein C0520_01165 [Sphingopyxis sp.]|nr:hypothetical protein [Sphingopyxis sp.]